MRPQRVASLSIVLALMAGCGGDGTESSSGGEAPESTAADRAERGVDAGLDAAIRVLAPTIERLDWPERYTPTVEGLTEKLGTPDDVIYTEENGRDLVIIWNLCAWSLEGVDQISAGAAPAQLSEVADQIEGWAAINGEPLQSEELADGVRIGDPSDVTAFAAANCTDFPH